MSIPVFSKRFDNRISDDGTQFLPLSTHVAWYKRVETNSFSWSSQKRPLKHLF